MFRREKRTRRVVMTGLAACAVLIGVADPRIGQASPLRATAPNLGTAASFAVLAGSTVTNTGATGINGNLGVSPGSAVTGFPPGVVTGGTIHAGDAVALQAQSDATTAYNSLAGQHCDFNLTGQDLGGMTLIPGVYCFSSSAQLTGALTLNGQGNPNAVFIFQIGSTLTTASTSSVLAINGAQSCNVFWQVGSSATLGTGTAFTGSILALTSNTLTTGASVNGRALAQTGAVTLDTNRVSSVVCSSSGSPTPVSTGSATIGTATSTPVIPVVVVNTPVPTATSASTAGAAMSTALAATSTVVAATPASTAAAATSTALAATSTALASTPVSTAAAATLTAVAATSTAVAATSTAASATSTTVAATSTSVAATTVTPTTLPTGTATIVPATPTQAVSTPTPTSAKQKTPTSAPTSTPSSSAPTTTATPVMQPTIPGTGAGGTYVYSSVRANKLNRAALISAAPATSPAIVGADGSNPTSPLVPLVLLGALAILAGRRVRRLRK